MKTYSPKAGEITHAWHVIDATDQPLGRLASNVAQLLKGKHKASYVPHLDTGDYVVVVNAARVAVTGRKLDQKMYYRHSGYPGALKSISLREVLAKHPTRVVEHAVRGMVPHTTLGRQMFRKLKVYAGPNHPHGGQVTPGSKQQQEGAQ
jgi:large subunit ribosomal protein L13